MPASAGDRVDLSLLRVANELLHLSERSEAFGPVGVSDHDFWPQVINSI